MSSYPDPADKERQAPTSQPRGIQVSGPVMGSKFLLWLILTAGASGLVIAFGAPKGQSVVSDVIGIAIAMGVMSLLFPRMMTISVDDNGFELHMMQMVVTIDWEDIVEVKSGRLSGTVVLRAPINWGMRAFRKVQFAVLDPGWRQKPTSVAILAGVASMPPPSER